MYNVYSLQGINTTALNTVTEWDFAPMQALKVGTHITGGDIYGTVHENRMIKHKVRYLKPLYIENQNKLFDLIFRRSKICYRNIAII